MLKITLAPHTELEWHSHPMPSAAYIVAGELTLERKRDGKKQRFTAGQAVSETVDTFHWESREPCCTDLFLRWKCRDASHSASASLDLASAGP